MKYEAEICYERVVYNADFNYATEIRINYQNPSYLMMSSF